MKKSITLSLLALATAFMAGAAPVSTQRAQTIALDYVMMQPGTPAGLSVQSTEKLNDATYLVHFSPVGFALVSADDCATPIIGYSTQGNLDSKRIPENMAYILDEASEVTKFQARRGTVNRTWVQIENGSLALSRANDEPVQPLIKVKWDQPAPFNQFCPGEGSNKAVVGCVAVAMSQAMSVQKYPVKPQGQVTYACAGYGQLKIDFEKEAAYDWDAIMSGTGNYKEVARLLYHAGMSVNMNYGSDGSGIPSNEVYRISNALKNNFGYGKEVTYYWRKDYHGDWKQLLLNELYAGRAIVYNAIDSKRGYGHSFNIDGFNGTLFNVNWGWGGYGNGYFSIDALADAQMGMNYDSSHVAVVGIGGLNAAFRSISLMTSSIEENLEAGSVLSTLLVNGELPTSDMKIEITGEYDSNTKKYKTVPFEYKDGQIVTTRPLSVSEGPIYVRVYITLKSDNSVRLSQGFYIDIETPQPIEHKTSLTYDRTAKTFAIQTKYGAQYVVKNAEGAQILSGKIDTMPRFEFSRDMLTKGTNTVTITVGGESYTLNIVK